ncbi:multicopper oxidase family protein [Salinibacterium sp. ZJ454]|uniref:multicopper oxidase family protein n=1 Tax=Salinibacterium sp. ZJ454 TaxID=2708339 RepID=UPI0014234A91|nr:multicopper oxidase family protein [Salinibacterium sp. ZJ454]
MSHQSLLGLDLALCVVGAALWLASGIVVARNSASRWGPRLTLGIALLGTLTVVGRILIVIAVREAGWWFIEEKALLALPVAALTALVALVIAVPPLVRRTRRRPVSVPPARVATALLAAGYGSAVGVVTTLITGYPLTLFAALSVLVLLVLLIAITAAVLSDRPPRTIGGLAALAVLALLASAGYGWLGTAAGVTAASASHGHGIAAAPVEPEASVSVADIRTAQTENPVRVTLEAQQQRVQLPSGASLDAWSYGSVPGQPIVVHQGDTVEVELRNRDIEDGVTVHWHGVDVPNGEDGVAGVTQNAVLPGRSFTYSFVAEDTGTYWYHTHQHSAEGVRRGLYGTLVVLPVAAPPQVDLTLPLHTFGETTLLGGSDRRDTVEVAPGQPVRLRLINTDQVPRWFTVTGAPFRVVAVDGRDLSGPTDVADQALRIPAGGRYDVQLTMPASAVAVRTASAPEIRLDLVAPGGRALDDVPSGLPTLDLFTYGTPAATSDMDGPYDVSDTLVLDRAMRFMNGLPGFGYTVNGAVYPLIPATEVSEGDLVHLTVVNRGTDTHPMHPHGHHVLVLSRNGVAPTGSPLWLDTFDVQPGEVWEVALRADNPGIWMDHCHNLDHAAEGMLLHLAYAGVASPFEHGGPAGNQPE